MAYYPEWLDPPEALLPEYRKHYLPNETEETEEDDLEQPFDDWCDLDFVGGV